MNRFLITLAAVFVLSSFAASAEDTLVKPVTDPKAALRVLKEQNAALLEEQTVLLERLEELQKHADQVRILARRT